MDLELGSGEVLDNVTEDDLRTRLEGEEFAVLSVDRDIYIQFATRPDLAGGYVLECQDGPVGEHYQAMDRPISFDRVLSAFLKYYTGDPTWWSDFQWQQMEAGPFGERAGD